MVLPTMNSAEDDSKVDASSAVVLYNHLRGFIVLQFSLASLTSEPAKAGSFGVADLCYRKVNDAIR